MRAILIDAENRDIREIEYKTFEELKKIMGIEWAQAVNCLPKRHACYIDEEGLLNNPQHFFIIDGYPQPLAGNGAIVGTNNHGDDTNCKLDLDFIQQRVHFLSLKDVQAGIRMGIVDYGTYITTSKGTEKISEITLNAFEEKKSCSQ